jgi:hypothetical protein
LSRSLIDRLDAGGFDHRRPAPDLGIDLGAELLRRMLTGSINTAASGLPALAGLPYIPPGRVQA